MPQDAHSGAHTGAPSGAHTGAHTGDRVGETPESAPIQQSPQQPAQAQPMQQQGDTGRRPAAPGDDPAAGRRHPDIEERDAPSRDTGRETQVKR